MGTDNKEVDNMGVDNVEKEMKWDVDKMGINGQ